MTVYIELVVLNNFAFNFLLLLSVDKVLRLKAKKWRLFLSDAAGTIGGTLLPLVSLPQAAAVAAKLFLSVLMMLAFYRFPSVKKFLAVWFSFLAATFLAGGALVAAFYILQKDFALTADLSVVSGVPLAAYAAGAVIAFVLIKNLTAYIYGKKARHPNELGVGVRLGDKDYSLKGFFDSGNLLSDNETGLPVLVVASRAFKDAVLEEARLHSFSDKPASAPHFLTYFTVAGSGKMFIVLPEKITVDDRPVEAVLGVPCGKFRSAEYDIMLNGKLALTESESPGPDKV